MTSPWWRHAVVYQVYIRSFADANDDGTGDINGLRSKLGYLRDLGVDAIWINPWYRSPLHDGGYDVADYRDIEPRYGDIDQAAALITEAHDHGIKVLVDLVPNHTSSQHAWFQEAISSPIGHPSRRRYHILPGQGTDGELPPNDWTSVFGGSAWDRLPDGEWFLHLFDHTQPDLNWTNPEVIEEFENIFRFWLDKGVDGFRVDVAHGCAKDMSYPDLGTEGDEILQATKVADHPYWDRDDVHDIIRGWRAVLDSYEGHRMMVAEAWVPTTERMALYLRPDEYQQSFNFNFLEVDWDAAAMTEVIASSCTDAAAVGSAPTWVLSNHDVVRHATRYGLPAGTNWRHWLLDGPHEILDAELGLQRAKAATLVILSLPGSAYLYQGEELGLPEVWDLPPEVLDDPVWEQSEHTIKGRDGCRVPIPWTTDGPAFGFGETSPWLPMPEAFGPLSAEAQTGDPASTLEFYRGAIAIRREHLSQDESIELVEAPENIVAFRRGSGVECWLNVGVTDVALPEGEILFSSGTLPPGSPAMLPGNTAVLLRR
ncbi:MAG: glycoside hydrolase family 13 protein [Acidimicrobiales bacterium]